MSSTAERAEEKSSWTPARVR